MAMNKQQLRTYKRRYMARKRAMNRSYGWKDYGRSWREIVKRYLGAKA